MRWIEWHAFSTPFHFKVNCNQFSHSPIWISYSLLDFLVKKNFFSNCHCSKQVNEKRFQKDGSDLNLSHSQSFQHDHALFLQYVAFTTDSVAYAINFQWFPTLPEKITKINGAIHSCVYQEWDDFHIQRLEECFEIRNTSHDSVKLYKSV